MKNVLNQINNEIEEILKRNKVKSLIKLGDKAYGSDDYIRAYALYNAHSVLGNNETLEHFLNRPTSIMWLNGRETQKKIINLTVEIVKENRK